MNRRNLIAIFIIAVVAIVTIAIIVSLDDSDGAGLNDPEVSQEAENDNALGIDVAALQGPYRLTVVSDDNEQGEETSAVFQIDGEGNIDAVVVNNGEESGFRYVDQITYIQNPQDGTWLAYPVGSASAPTLDPGELALSNEDINEISNDPSLKDLGVQPCRTGTCRVYQDEDEFENATVRIDTTSNRIIEVEVTNKETGARTTINYEYSVEINIVAPDNAVQLDAPQQPSQ